MLLTFWLFELPTFGTELSPLQSVGVLEEAQQAYDRGIAILRSDPAMARQEFRSAAERFQYVADSGGMNGKLYYNLGNAYWQSGEIGRAILNYRTAETLIPSDGRLRSNLEYARSQCRSRIESGGTQKLRDAVLGWYDRTPLRWRFGIFVICHAVLWLTLAAAAVGFLRLRGVLSMMMIAVAVIWFITGASAAGGITGWGEAAAGVLLLDDVIVRKGNGVGFEPLYEQPLHAGVEFTVLDKRGDWIEIRLANGDHGWIEAIAAGVVRNPAHLDR